MQVVLEAEISREQIPLRNAYKHIGQRATIRINSGVDTELPGDTLPLQAYLSHPCNNLKTHVSRCFASTLFPQIICTAVKNFNAGSSSQNLWHSYYY